MIIELQSLFTPQKVIENNTVSYLFKFKYLLENSISLQEQNNSSTVHVKLWRIGSPHENPAREVRSLAPKHKSALHHGIEKPAN